MSPWVSQAYKKEQESDQVLSLLYSLAIDIRLCRTCRHHGSMELGLLQAS